MTPSFHSFRKLIEQFVKLTDEEWEMMVPHLTEKVIKKNDYMIREGQIGKELGYVVQGDMRHFYTRDGEEKTTYFYFENALVGPYMSCVTGQPSQLSIEALTETHLLVFPYTAMKALYDQSHTWEKFGRVLAEYLAIGLEERMVGLLTLSPEERYMHLLESNKKKILERIPQHLIANYLGVTPVSLSRIRNRIFKK
jgi:CRP-like cAMP-binding protein